MKIEPGAAPPPADEAQGPGAPPFESDFARRIKEHTPETVSTQLETLMDLSKASVPFMPYVMDMSATAITQVSPLIEQHRNTLSLIDQYACSKLDTLERTTNHVCNIVTGVEQSVAPLVNVGISAVDAVVETFLPEGAKDDADGEAQEDAADAAAAPSTTAAEAAAPLAMGTETAKVVRRIRAVSSKAQTRIYEKALENIRNAHVRSEGAVQALRPFTIDLIAYDAGEGSSPFAATQQALELVKAKSAALLDDADLKAQAQGALNFATGATNQAFMAINATQAAVAARIESAKARANEAVAHARDSVDRAIAVIEEAKAAAVRRASALSREEVTAFLESLRLKADDLRLQLQSLTREDVIDSAIAVRDNVYERLRALPRAEAETHVAMETTEATEAPAVAEPVAAADAGEPPATTGAAVTEARKVSFTLGAEPELDADLADLEAESNEAMEQLVN